MIPSAARMRTWVLWAAPLMAALGFLWHAGGAAAGFSLWLLLPLLFPGRATAKRIRTRPLRGRRLFLAWAAGLFGLTSLNALVNVLLQSGNEGTKAGFLSLLGAVCFSLLLCRRALRLPLPGKIAWAAGGAMLALSLAIFLKFLV